MSLRCGRAFTIRDFAITDVRANRYRLASPSLRATSAYVGDMVVGDRVVGDKVVGGRASVIGAEVGACVDGVPVGAAAQNKNRSQSTGDSI
jgi:hypothetical protein